MNSQVSKKSALHMQLVPGFIHSYYVATKLLSSHQHCLSSIDDYHTHLHPLGRYSSTFTNWLGLLEPCTGAYLEVAIIAVLEWRLNGFAENTVQAKSKCPKPRFRESSPKCLQFCVLMEIVRQPSAFTGDGCVRYKHTVAVFFVLQ